MSASRATAPRASAPASASAARLAHALRPHPHRGDLVAAGAVVLTVGMATVNARMAVRWDHGILLVLTLLVCALVYGMGVLAPLESDAPRAYQSTLLVAGLVLWVVTLYRLAQVLGEDHPLRASGTVVWVGLLFTLLATATARHRSSAICTLLAAAGATVTTLAFVQWVFAPSSPTTFRYLLALLAAAFGLGAVSLRDRRRRHAVALVDAAGLSALALAGTYVGFAGVLFAAAGGGSPAGVAHAGTGWALFLLIVGCGLLAYASVDREPGPGYLGFFVLVAFVLVAGPPDGGASLIGWPIVLLGVGGAVVAIGLRPRVPLPPAPDAGAPPGRTFRFGGRRVAAPTRHPEPGPAPDAGEPSARPAVPPSSVPPARPAAPPSSVPPGPLPPLPSDAQPTTPIDVRDGETRPIPAPRPHVDPAPPAPPADPAQPPLPADPAQPPQGGGAPDHPGAPGPGRGERP